MKRNTFQLAIFLLLGSILSAVPKCMADEPSLSVWHISSCEASDPELFKRRITGAAVEFLGLIASYRPESARAQFNEAHRHLVSPGAMEFEKTVLGEELPIIESSKRTQMFFVERNRIVLELYPDRKQAVIRVPGIRRTITGDVLSPEKAVVYYIKVPLPPNNSSARSELAIKDVALREEAHSKR